ncbi:beta-lactamase family protein [Maribacter sp. ANRC-HE7]|uniref:Beta-lactamase family protein n=1 Tax=Maribacter aquimaris TaxID=2737171 RepID=A0ABR7V333_9FLAO|nr:serine hydrolase domain-containing protein [Maribacter aquimaris]MBD0779228.1 beta-lactamase family protein [Maribacter aquimaris]
MNRIAFIFFLSSFCLATNFAHSQDLGSQIDELYQVNTNEPGFSIAVFHGDKIIVEKQYGSSHLDYNIPVTNETVFDIGSIAKQFTAAAILLLENQGKLSIKDPAYKYIDNLPRYKEGNPTIAHLLNQTSGIKEVDPYLEICDIHWRDYIRQSMLVNIITNIEELHFTPGDYFYYSNANYILLASIVEKASGMSFGDYLQTTIFEPLNMQHTILNVDVYRTIPNRAIGYTEDEGQFYKTHQYGLYFAGDGQIITNPEDMFQWHQNIKNSTIGTPEIWKRMFSKATLNDGTIINFGLGVEFETHNGYEAMGFDGMISSGFVSKYLYFPELDIAFFTTQNTFDWDFKDRFFKLIDLYIPQNKETENESPDHKRIKLSRQALKKYEGSYLYYYNDVDRKANNIKLVDDQLQVFTLDGDKITELIPLGNHKFLFGEEGNALVTFNLNENEKQYTYDELENEKPWVFKTFHPYEHSEKELKEYEGHYFNKAFQISKKLQLENGKLYYYYRNGAWKDEMGSLSKDVLEIPISPVEFIRNNNDEIEGFKIMGLLFEKI